ncbi:MAG: acyl-CoA dehydrogenase family protein [Actinomycetota bacterium]|nr:acyl-CoA dehydrogenase family protein [Actinomycetota bacterium]
MDFDLSPDQVALRDGIRSLCEGRFPIKRVREGFDRSAHAELAEAGVFSLRADGFGVADAAVVFEQLGRAAVPGPLVWAYLAHGVVDGIAGGLETGERQPPWMIEHIDALDTLLVVDETTVRAVPASKIAGAVPVGRPLDPLTPVHRVDVLPSGDTVGGDDLLARWRLEGPVVTAAFLVGMAQACTDLSVAYAKERRQFDRPIGSFQAVKHLLADMLVRTEVARACVHARRSRRRRRCPRRGGGEDARRRDRHHQRQDRHAGARRHGLHVGGRRAPVPEAGLGARHGLRLRRRARRGRGRDPRRALMKRA